MDGWTWVLGHTCWIDQVSSRSLIGDTMVVIDGGSSPEKCTAACDAQGFMYAGVEFGSECHCGTRLA